MKPFLLLLVLSFILFSCGSNTEKGKISSYSDFKVLIDTIQVDPGDDILMAGAEIRNPGISKDNKWLYSWDQKNYAIEFVNLEEYKLEKKVHLEKEGPQGIGPNYFYRVDAFPNELFGFEDFESYRVYNLQGDLQRKISFEEDWIADQLKRSENFELYSVNEKGSILAGIPFDFNSFDPLLLLIDWENQKMNKVQLKEFDKLKKYSVLLKMDGKNMAISRQDIFMKFQGDSIIISNTAFNDVYLYNISTQNLKYVAYNQQIISNNKQKIYKNETSSEEEFNQIANEIRSEVEFTQFYYDESKQKYYRFASEVINTEEEEPRIKVFVTIYDKKLKLIGEKELMTFKSAVTPLFIRDGAVHFYLNMEDELGFIRIRIGEN